MSNPKYKNIGSPLTRTIEECAEVIQIICKIKRFGWFSYHPDDLTKTSNIKLLENEMNDVIDTFKELKLTILKNSHRK